MKRLFSEAALAFVTWLISGAQFIQIVATELEDETIFADILAEIRINGQKVLLHIEFQKKRDGDMAKRLWQYNTRATIKYGCPVWSCVIYLTKAPAVEAVYGIDLPNGQAVHRFAFSVIKMWEVPTQELLRPELRDLAPLLPLTQGGQSREVVETAIGLLDPAEGVRKQELLTLLYGLASLVLPTEAERDWLDWRFGMLYEILKDSPAWQTIARRAQEEGLEKGLQEGLEKGLEKGLQEGLEKERLTVLDLVEARFADPALVEQTRAHIAGITDLEALRQLIVKVALLPQAEELPALLAQYPPAALASQPARKRATRPRTSRKQAADEVSRTDEP